MSNYRERNAKFVEYICSLCSKNKGIAAHLRRADLENTDPLVLQTLVRFGLDITKISEFIPFCLVTAAIARGKKYETGSDSFIHLLSSIEKSNSGKCENNDFRFRRLLASESLNELSLVFRPVMSFVQSRINSVIDYIDLLNDLCSFAYDDGRARVKRKWAVQFYKESQQKKLVEK